MTGADNHLVGLGAMYETSKRQENWLEPIAHVHSLKLMDIQVT